MNSDPPTYYNTNHEQGEVLKESQRRGQVQEDIIYNFFISYPFRNFTRDEVHRMCFSNNIPYTSVQRALTNLHHKDKLEKTDIMKMGGYGKMVHTWRLKIQLTLF